MEADVRQVAESALDRLRKVLPAEQLEAAIDRGKTLELGTVIAELEGVEVPVHPSPHK
jgi:hypothetical protein